MANYSRSCTKYLPNCPCTGNSTQFAEANTEACSAPREPCCPGYTLQADNTCGPAESKLPPEVTAPNPIPSGCIPGGYWQEWGPWSSCSATCGMCGTTMRNRTCVTGCSCSPKDGCQVKACGGPVCPSGDKCCNNSAVTIGYDGAEYCNPFAEKILEAGGNLTCEGCWTEWADARGENCNHTCGLCGSVKQERFCMPSGCTCEDGERERVVPCTSTPCTTAPECCDPYEPKTLTNGTIICDVPCISTWSQWYPSSNISSYDYCGGCYEENYYRTCLSNDTCPCNTFSRPGNIQVCYYPRRSCCDPLTHMIIDGIHACGPQTPLPPDPAPPSFNATACPEYGYWGAWSSWSTCAGNLTCGMCGIATRNRTCISEDWNCPCCDEGTEEKPCGDFPCEGDEPCCECSYLTTLFNGEKVCNPYMEFNCTGTWTEWLDGGRTNCGCGACGNRTEYRQCFPSGCECEGNFTRILPCTLTLCEAPSPPCCAPFGPYTWQDTDTTVCGPCDGNYSWTEWVNAPGAVCTDTCGTCGLINQVRKCRYGCCPWNEPKTRQVPCGTTVCLYPRTSCCDPYKKMIIGSQFVCGLANWTTPAITTTTVAPPCPSWGGTWSAWSLAPNQIGYDFCGACWLANYVRTCLDGPSCPCIGPSTAQGDANLDVCLYPRLSCCPGKTKQIVNGSFICGPNVQLPPDPAPPASDPSYCSPYGYWGSWGSWSSCTATCGACGTKQRNRTCVSAPGCPCRNPSANIAYQSERCAQTPCPGNMCCNGFAVMLGYDEAYSYCAPSSTPPVCAGTWSAWQGPNAGYPNTTTCTAQERYCFPSGCQCPGSKWQNVPCGNTVCYYPRQSCCTPYKKIIVNGAFICG